MTERTDILRPLDQEQAERLAGRLNTPRAEFKIRKNAWGAPVVGSLFEFNGRTWRVETPPVDDGDAWAFAAIDFDASYGALK